MLSSKPISDEAKRQHVAEANEFVYGGTPMAHGPDVHSEIVDGGGVEHLKQDQQEIEKPEC